MAMLAQGNHELVSAIISGLTLSQTGIANSDTTKI